jgi:hypothetical protein
VPFDQKTFGASKAGIVALLNTDRRAVANRQLEMLAPELLVYRAPPIAAGDAASAITSDGAAPAETVDEGASFLAKDICDDTPKDKDIDSSEPSPALAVAYLSYWFVDAKRLLGQEINIPGIAADQKADLLHSHFTNHPKLTADFIGHFLFSQECQATRERLEERLRANVWEEAGILGKVVDLARPATSSPTPSPSPPAK